MKVISNYHERLFKYGDEVPSDVLTQDYDWLDDNFDGWIHYLGRWYHVSDFMRYDDEYWHGVVADTYFSGVLIKLSDDGGTYQIGRYFA